MNKVVIGEHPRAYFKKQLFCRSSASMLTIAGLVGFFATPALGNDWDFSPYIGISEQFTDNARSSRTDKESDFITTVDLGFTISGETRRTKLETSYDLSKDYYAENHDLDGIRHNFLSDASIELLDDSFFIDARITFTEETLSTSGATTATNRTQASDRTQVFNGQISPYYVYDFGGWMTGIARYSYSETIFSEPDAGASTTEEADRKTNEYRLNLNSGRRFARASWGLQTGLISSESDAGENFDHFNSAASGQVPINRLFSAIGTLGYDDFDADNIDNEEISGVYGGTGIRFHPSSRTDASFQIGYRFGDPVFDMDITYSPTSADRLTASYKVTVQTADQSLTNARLLDQQGDLIQPQFTVIDYVDSVTKSETFSLDWSRDRGRNRYGVSGRYIQREILENNTNDDVISVNANYGRSLTPRADLSFNAAYAEVLEGQASADEETTLTFGTTYRYNFGRGLSGTISYDFLNRSNDSESDLTENALSLSIRKKF
ncbi:MAG: TIGR03016 family PEP-CTERM system-associated outer membrane protein [Sneathiella sp.]